MRPHHHTKTLRYMSCFNILNTKYFKIIEKVKVAQSCPVLCKPMDYTFHGLLQARILEWLAFPFSSPNPGIEPRSPTFQVFLNIKHLPIPALPLVTTILLFKYLFNIYLFGCTQGFPGGSTVKNPPAMQETWIQSLGWEDGLEKGTATHSNILAWRSPWNV